MTNYIKRFGQEVLAACRRLFSEQAAKTVRYSERTACQWRSYWQWNVDGDSKLGKQTYSMKSQILFHVTPCWLTATRVAKNHSHFVFRIKQTYKIHLRLFDLEYEGTAFLQKHGNYWPFGTTLHSTCHKYFPSARRHLSLL